MSDKNQWVNDVGIIAVSKNGGKPYIKFEKGFVAEEGDRLVMKKKEDEINETFDAGKITEDRRDELLEKLSWIKYTLHKPPRNAR